MRAQNDRSLKILQADTRYEDLHAKALTILEAKDRIPMPGFRAEQVYNFWQDDVNVRGLLRRTTVDRLSRRQRPDMGNRPRHRRTRKGRERELGLQGRGLPRARRDDAAWSNCPTAARTPSKSASSTTRQNRSSKTASACRPASKSADWLDADTLYVGARLGSGHDDGVGLPFIVKLWKRGTKLEDAPEVYRGKQNDVPPAPA